MLYSYSPRGVKMGEFHYNRPAVLPGSVLDLVIDGTVPSRFDACVRITDIAWKYGSQSCRNETEYQEWHQLYVEHLMALLAALEPNTSPDREVWDGGLQSQQVEQT